MLSPHDHRNPPRPAMIPTYRHNNIGRSSGRPPAPALGYVQQHFSLKMPAAPLCRAAGLHTVVVYGTNNSKGCSPSSPVASRSSSSCLLETCSSGGYDYLEAPEGGRHSGLEYETYMLTLVASTVAPPSVFGPGLPAAPHYSHRRFRGGIDHFHRNRRS